VKQGESQGFPDALQDGRWVRSSGISNEIESSGQWKPV